MSFRLSNLTLLAPSPVLERPTPWLMISPATFETGCHSD